MTNNYSDSQNSLKAVIAGILALIPFGVLIAMVFRYNVDVPHLDQWALIPLLEKSFDGTVTFSDLWAQHNEHRLVFPRLIMLVMARSSGWNMFYEYAVSVICAAGLLITFIVCLRFAERRSSTERSYWLIPLFSLLVFSLGQWENWYLGWQFQIFLNLLAFAVGILVLAMAPFSWLSLIAAIICGIIASFSFANGLVYWIIGGMLLVVLYSDKGVATINRKRVHMLIWGLVSGLTIMSYLYGYKTPPVNSALGYALTHPFMYMAYICKYLGGAIIHVRHTTPLSISLYNYAALSIGLVAMIAYLIICWKLIFNQRTKLVAIAPVVALALYPLASALLAGQGRMEGHGGSGQALSSRYVTIANLFWISLLILIHLYMSSKPDSGKLLMRALAAIMVCIMCLSSRYGFISWEERHDYLLKARGELVSGEDKEIMKRVFRKNDKPHMEELRETLKELELSVFRDQDE